MKKLQKYVVASLLLLSVSAQADTEKKHSMPLKPSEIRDEFHRAVRWLDTKWDELRKHHPIIQRMEDDMKKAHKDLEVAFHDIHKKLLDAIHAGKSDLVSAYKDLEKDAHDLKERARKSLASLGRKLEDLHADMAEKKHELVEKLEKLLERKKDTDNKK